MTKEPIIKTFKPMINSAEDFAYKLINLSVRIQLWQAIEPRSDPIAFESYPYIREVGVLETMVYQGVWSKWLIKN